MDKFDRVTQNIATEGFSVIDPFYSDDEINALIEAITSVDSEKTTFRKSNGLFAIRRFFKEVPAASGIVFSDDFRLLIRNIFGDGYFVVKGIYFDKPGESNWFVAYHQDLTISVDQKKQVAGFGPWTVKQDQFAVQPPLSILKDNFTIRIHLDAADEFNGALKVIPKSHTKSIYRHDSMDWNKETEITCAVEKGGIMIMKPLLLHASSRTTNGKQRRVLHIEFSRSALPDDLNWSEKFSF